MPRTGKMIERAGTLDPYSGYTSVKDDPEFVSRVKALIGAPYQSLVDPSVAANVKNPNRKYTVLGENFFGKTDEDKANEAEHLGIAALPEGKRIFGIGAGASPSTWAHEFRHDEIKNEYANRLMDFIHGSTSRDAYVANVEGLWGHNKDYKKDYETPFEEREKYALEQAANFLVPSYNRVNGIYPDVDQHVEINSKGVNKKNEFIYHPIDSLMGNTVDTEKGRIARGTAVERATYPFLLFAGRPDLPRSKEHSGASLGEEVPQEKTSSKKRGGFIENTTHDRKII